MNICNYNKVTGKVFDISTVAKPPYGSIEVTDECKVTYLTGCAESKEFYVDLDTFEMVCIDPSTIFSYTDKLSEVKSFRDELLQEQTFYHMTDYQDRLLEFYGIVVDTTVLTEYHRRILLIEHAYATSLDPENFEVIIVEEFSEVAEDNIFEIVKPDFITAPKEPLDDAITF